jgi:cell wall assembly regulator SMI1
MGTPAKLDMTVEPHTITHAKRGAEHVERIGAVGVCAARHRFAELVVVAREVLHMLLHTLLRSAGEDGREIDLAPSAVFAAPFDRARRSRDARRHCVEIDGDLGEPRHALRLGHHGDELHPAFALRALEYIHRKGAAEQIGPRSITSLLGIAAPAMSRRCDMARRERRTAGRRRPHGTHRRRARGCFAIRARAMGRVPPMGDLRAACKRIEAWMGRHAPSMLDVSAPATPARIAELEAALGGRMPGELAEWLSIHDGEGFSIRGAPADTDWTLLGAGRIREDWAETRSLHAELDAEYGAAAVHHRVEGPMTAASWKEGWIPLASDGAGDKLCFDLEPEPGGSIGQLVVVSRDASPHKVVAASLAEVLESFADGLERGDYEIEPFVGIVPRSSRADE